MQDEREGHCVMVKLTAEREGGEWVGFSGIAGNNGDRRTMRT
jgi:hypothetical protein